MKLSNKTICELINYFHFQESFLAHTVSNLQCLQSLHLEKMAPDKIAVSLCMMEFSQQQNISDPPINFIGTRNEVYKVTVSYSGANDDTAYGERVSVRLPVTESLCIVAFIE